MKMNPRAEARRAGLVKLGYIRRFYESFGNTITNRELRRHLAPRPKTLPAGWHPEKLQEGQPASATLDRIARKLVERHPELADRIERPGFDRENWHETLRIRPAGERGEPIQVQHGYGPEEVTLGFSWWHEHIDIKPFYAKANAMKSYDKVVDAIEGVMAEDFVAAEYLDDEGGWQRSHLVDDPDNVEPHPEWSIHLVSYAGKHDRVIPPSGKAEAGTAAEDTEQ